MNGLLYLVIGGPENTDLASEYWQPRHSQIMVSALIEMLEI